MIFVQTRKYNCVSDWRGYDFDINLPKNENKLVSRITYMIPGIYERRKKRHLFRKRIVSPSVNNQATDMLELARWQISLSFPSRWLQPVHGLM